MEAISQWAASLCFAAAAGGLCQMLAPDSGMGRVLKLEYFGVFSVQSPAAIGCTGTGLSDVCKYHSRKIL